MRDPKPPYVCTHAGCERLRVAGREVCREHTDTRKERATYRCSEPGCKRLHYSNGRCHMHYCQENGLFMTQDGQPYDLVGAAAHAQKRIKNEMETILALLRWEEKNRHDES